MFTCPFFFFLVPALMTGKGLQRTDKLNLSLCTFQYPVRAVYRVWPTVTGPSGEDAGLHHHPWQSGAGTRPSPIPATRRPQGPAARSAQHSGHHHDYYDHRNQDHHHHKTYNQQLQEGCPREFGFVGVLTLCVPSQCFCLVIYSK